MNTLTRHDLQFALMRCPKALLHTMKATMPGKIFVGGGFLRSIVSGEPVNDVDVFVSSKEDALTLARMLVIRKLRFVTKKTEAGGITVIRPLQFRELNQDQVKQTERGIYTTDNAYTLTGFSPSIQIIHRWVFDAGDLVAASFDFTCCAAAFWWDGETWKSYCDERFYCDVASKRLVYRAPKRNEDAGGSMLRVLKYYQRGYRIPLDSLAKVIARLVKGVDLTRLVHAQYQIGKPNKTVIDEAAFSFVIAGLLREVDPQIDPGHVAHLPAEDAAYETAQVNEAKDNTDHETTHEANNGKD
jgi:hypothetical protein